MATMPRPPPLAAGIVAAPVRVSMRMFHGDVFLGEAEVFSIKPGAEGALPFPSNEIRISNLSPQSERCPPLAILQTIAPFSVRCKLQAKPLPPHPSLHRLYLTCFNEYKSAVVVAGDEELHLVAMPSRVEKVPCFPVGWMLKMTLSGYQGCLQKSSGILRTGSSSRSSLTQILLQTMGELLAPRRRRFSLCLMSRSVLSGLLSGCQKGMQF